MNQYEVEVYEPACDPGGYVRQLRVEADNEFSARVKALKEVYESNPGIWWAVYEVKELGE